MEAFKEAWFAIDTQGKLQISAEDLQAYMQKNNYDESFVNKWLNLFDEDKSGTIELEEFCDVLGLNYKETMSEVREKAASGGMPNGVVVVYAEMELSWQIKIAQLCLEGLRVNKKTKDVPIWVKKKADEMYGRLWHLVLLNGQFWCDFGYAPGHAFIFKFEKHIFLIWKTPLP
ncbi:hypothetical protein BOX15_Mlig022705g1 [Macrostomum lignano]|uniref:EF-hand domain-containing protein n=1 Tax=Macrostomum lignano TaxID=282301 RepID=A0A267H2Y8_9PLAT|nr:hypothetical protein BOX15_Mlig022705g1 [Macrostomum lignano]